MSDTQTHGHQTESGHPKGGGRREWPILKPKLLAIARSLDNKIPQKTILSNFGYRLSVSRITLFRLITTFSWTRKLKKQTLKDSFSDDITDKRITDRRIWQH
jgi:hypothetical protein